MLMQKLVYSENGHFNLKLHISTSSCRTFTNKMSLKSSFALQTIPQFSQIFHGLFLLPSKVQLSQKTKKLI